MKNKATAQNNEIAHERSMPPSPTSDYSTGLEIHPSTTEANGCQTINMESLTEFAIPETAVTINRL
jgi:hypothetical protein